MIIAGEEIGPHMLPYMVAEMSGNHSGNILHAINIIKAAAAAGADAVKIQLYEPSDLAIADSPLWHLYAKSKTPREWYGDLKRYADLHNVTLFASVFSVDGVKFLDTMGCPAYKIASPEIVRHDLLKAVAATGKPVIISTGMAHMRDVSQAIKLVPDCALLHCVSHYPCWIEDSNLKAITTLYDYTRKVVGLSDHTPGYETAIAAVALGASIIEKHIKIDEDCVDATYSLNPDQFGAMVTTCRAIWEGMGTGLITPTCEPRQR